MSNYNEEHNVIFVHIPKNAGSSMESKLFIGGNGHETLQSIKDRIGEDAFKKAFKFAFVRNPLDRLVSTFHSQQGINGRYPMNKDGFTQFIKEINDHKLHFHFLPQSHFIGDGSEMDFIGRYETLEKDWNEVCKRIKVSHLDTKLPWIRKGKWERAKGKIPWNHYYTPETKEIVMEYYKVDFRNFNY